MTEAYNPLSTENLAESVAGAILRADPVPLAAVPRFEGAGLYAIYYSGDFPAYERASLPNRDGVFELPIYVGKATPQGGRTGIALVTSGTPLYRRIQEHAKSIEEAGNLDIGDFHVRWLVVESIWIPLGESTLISHFKPLWNAAIDSFGNHDPGSGRYEGARSRWDELHPGRSWASRQRDARETLESIGRRVSDHFEARDAER